MEHRQERIIYFGWRSGIYAHCRTKRLTNYNWYSWNRDFLHSGSFYLKVIGSHSAAIFAYCPESTGNKIDPIKALLHAWHYFVGNLAPRKDLGSKHCFHESCAFSVVLAVG